VKHIPAWFPFAAFQRQALEWHSEILNSVLVPYARAKHALVGFDILFVVSALLFSHALKQAAGGAIPSLVSRILEDNGKDMSEEHLMWFAGGLCKLSIAPNKRPVILGCSSGRFCCCRHQRYYNLKFRFSNDLTP
jgi:hypothetical protein